MTSAGEGLGVWLGRLGRQGKGEGGLLVQDSLLILAALKLWFKKLGGINGKPSELTDRALS